MNLGQTIKQIRKRRGMNQHEFAEMCGVSQTSISKIEKGKTRPHPPLMQKICEVLQYTEATLLLISIQEDDLPHKRRHIINALLKEIKIQLEMP